MGRYPFYSQLNIMDCGASCLRMIAAKYGKHYSQEHLRKKCYSGKIGVSLWQLSNAATDIGFRSLYARVSFEDLSTAEMPCIVHWRGHHFVVVYKIGKKTVTVGDPASGILTYSHADFIEGWSNESGESVGIVLVLEPTPRLYVEEEEKKNYIGFRFFLNYLLPFKKYYVQLMLGMLVSMGFTLILPFLNQSLIDVGIVNKNIGFINLVLISQLMFSVSSTVLNFVRSWIFLHVGTRIDIAIISDYLIKLFKLPMSFFEKTMMGDIMQRIGDHGRIQGFISAATLSTLFSLLNFFIFSGIMAYYSPTILLIFLLFSAVYTVWVILFLKQRRQFDYKFFQRSSQKQNTLIQLLTGIRDIKQHNYEEKKRWEWERLQAATFRLSIKQLVLSQFQSGGGFLIETTKGVIISYLSARLVVEGKITLGMMLSIQYILGQIGAPISQMIGLINSYQDATISLERIGEIHATENEEKGDGWLQNQLPSSGTIRFEKVSFSYNGSAEQMVLKDVSFTIPENKVTAIVGGSGSGKTTVLKLLLKFYSPTKGRVSIGNFDLETISHRAWRDHCGAVLQDGYIFSDTIAENIAVGDEDISLDKLENAAEIANISEFIRSMPQAYNTKIGPDGVGVSQGQRQRLLISRAVYRNPAFIMLDEATNALDSKNEGEILDKLQTFCKNRTVVVVAHRLSTVRHADQIIVLEDGKVVEIGRHEELIAKRDHYYDLVKKQTEILA
ncbi:MAG: peptidase domain-containing ABC transporter [Bacteroidetes bacterium]|nr:peptidase domain-containing ABC transporter [Bacteroidota bacterium]